MRYNAELAVDQIPKGPESRNPLHVDGYKWGNPVEPLLAYIPPLADGSRATGFDVLIMADVIYSHREHGNLVKTMQQTLKRTAESVALVIFTPYEPWLLPQTERFFPLAEAGGFTVTKIFEKMMGQVLFEDDPGVSGLILEKRVSDNEILTIIYRMKNFAERFLDTNFAGLQTN